MKYIEYHNLVDREGWDQGPWDSEPDKIQFVDKETSLPCLIIRNNSGNLCGYVGIQKGHPLYGKYYHEINIEVHRGLTFSSKCSGDEEGICHKVEEGENDDVWWLGFDCRHYGDLSPITTSWPSSLKWRNFETYRDISYVKDQIFYLAKQLKNYK